VTKLTRRLVETNGVLALKDKTIIAEIDSLFYIRRQSKKTVLWDMDGVIADSGSYHFAAWQETFAERGIKFTKEDFIKFFGTRNDFIIRSILGDKTCEKDIETIIQKKESNFRERIKGNIKPFPGAIKLLAAIKKGNFKLGLVSSAPGENIDLLLGELDLGECFNCVISGREVKESKPNPQIFLLAAEKCGVEPQNCIVIEDSPLGVKAAKAAGMRCLAVANAHTKQELTEADRIVDSLEEVDLITLIQRV
jgi:beta-phosphoglucomutase family hydrolase